MAAFNIGRIAAAAPERLVAQNDPRGHLEPKTLDELIDDRATRLIAYQNEFYAQQYRDAVTRVRTAEEAAGLGDKLSRAAATYAFKLMAYKDEYEVARLYTNGDFAKQLASQFKGGKLRFWMAPPLISKRDSHGHLKKKHFGGWMMLGFKILTRLKGLRETPFDLFGRTEERKMERALRDTYLETLETLAADLTATNHTLAMAIAEIPDDIRGYGHVKDAAVALASETEAALWKGWPMGNMPKVKTTLIAAE
jgi:indolepyruvate ferredoxin oxidoreductase